MKLSSLVIALLCTNVAMAQTATTEPKKKTVTTVTTTAADGTQSTTVTEVVETVEGKEKVEPVVTPVTPAPVTPIVVEIPGPSVPESRIYNLMYMPAKGTFVGETSFDYSSTDSTANYQSREYAKFNVLTSDVRQALAYALSDNFLLGVAGIYQFKSSQETTYGVASKYNGTVVTTKSDKGMKEPQLLIKYRAASQESSGRNVDLSMIIAPKVGTAKSSNTEASGNGLEGNTQVKFKAEVGMKDSSSEWVMNFNLDYYGEAAVEDASDSTYHGTAKAYAVIAVGYTYQWIFNKTFNLNLGGSIGAMGKRETNIPTSNLRNKYDATAVVTLGPEFIFNLSPKALISIALIGEGLADYQQTQTNIVTGASTNLDYEDVAVGKLVIGARYEF